MAVDDRFVYSGPELPIGGKTGQVLTKVAGANYYTAWRSLEDNAIIISLLERVADLESRVTALEP